MKKNCGVVMTWRVPGLLHEAREHAISWDGRKAHGSVEECI